VGFAESVHHLHQGGGDLLLGTLRTAGGRRLVDIEREILDGRTVVVGGVEEVGSVLPEEVGTVLPEDLERFLGEQVFVALVHGLNLTGSR